MNELRRRWTAEEVDTLRQLWGELSREEIARQLGRSDDSIRNKVNRLHLHVPFLQQQRPRWTEAEILLLEDNWGMVSISAISRRLGRSRKAVRAMATRRQLGPQADSSGRFVSFSQLLNALGIANNSQSRRRMVAAGLPVRESRLFGGNKKSIYLDDFWDWAEQNRELLRFDRLEPLALGVEPDWVQEKRRTDFKVWQRKRKHMAGWTSYDDDRLRWMVQQRKTVAEMASILCRTKSGIRNRLEALGLPMRGKRADWRDAE